MIELEFEVDVQHDWPPVKSENLWCYKSELGYVIKSIPFFVKGVSVGDEIKVELADSFLVKKWEIIRESDSSIMWLMIHNQERVKSVLVKLLSLGCNIEELKQYNYCAVEIPAVVKFGDINSVFSELTEDDLDWAFPVYRH